MRPRLAQLLPSQIERDDVRVLAAVTGLSKRAVSARVRSARDKATMRSIFKHEWPTDAETLGAISVGTALVAQLEEDISAAADMTIPMVRTALTRALGKALLRDVIPVLNQAEDEEAEEEVDAYDDDDDEEEGVLVIDGPPSGLQRFLDEASTFSVGELVGAIRVVSLRKAPGLVEWLADCSGVSARSLAARVNRANGRTSVRTLMSDTWPFSVGEPPRDMLTDLTTGAVRGSPSLVRWVADVAGVRVGEARKRLDAAEGSAAVGTTLAELAGKGGNAPKTNRGSPQSTRVRASVRDSEPPPSSRRGAIVGGRYELKRRLGEGGFGVAWEAMRLEHPRKLVVLKASSAPGKGRLREEMGIAFELRHQNICTYVDFGTDPALGTYLVMDHGGISLEQIIANEGHLALDAAIEIVRQAANGLDYAHSKGVIHQDVKPGNVLIDRKVRPAEVRLGDFGIALQGRLAKNTRGNYTVFATAPKAYSRGYAAPEQVRGQNARKATDQYSLALVFCSMLEGYVFGRQPYKPRKFGRLSARQNAAVARALREAPEERFETCSAFASELMRGNVEKHPLDKASAALLERIQKEDARPPTTARSHLIGGIAVVGSKLDEFLRALLEEVAAAAGRDPRDFLPVVGKGVVSLQRATAGQLLGAIRNAARGRKPPPLVRVCIDDVCAPPAKSVLDAIVQLRNGAVHATDLPKDANSRLKQLEKLLMRLRSDAGWEP